MTLSLPANRCTGHVILGLDRLTHHAAQMDREPELKIIRRAFAKQVMAACGVLQAALADLADVITYRTEEYAKVAKRR